MKSANLDRVQHRPAKVGVFSIGLGAYWPQFPGLRERLEAYRLHVESTLGNWAEIASAGLVDTAQAAKEAGERLAREGVDLLVVYAATYATSSQVLPVAQRVGVPVVVLNLQPTAAMDYEHTDTAEWLANCSACCVPEIANAFTRARIPFRVVSGMLYDDDAAWQDIREWCEAANVVRGLSSARIGFLGHTYPGMLDMYSDFTMHHAQLGTHIEVLEMCDLKDRVHDATDAETKARIALANQVFEVDAATVDPDDMHWAARVSVGLDRLVDDFALDALAYYYRGTRENEYERLGAGLILGNSLLTSRGIPCSGEGDLKNAVAMLIMDRFNAGGSYTELYAMDFRESFVLMGHDGPGHLAISDRKPVLRGLGLYHGKAGFGVSVEFNVKRGPVTILAVTQTEDGMLKLLAAEGESLPGPILKIGNTNSRIRFPLSPGDFVTAWCHEGPTHHCALGVGHVAGKVEKLAYLLGLAFVRVC